MTPSGWAYRGSRRAALAVLVVSIAVGAAASASADSLETVTIAIVPVEPTMQAAYADGRGFFRKQGIDARIMVLADPPLLAAAVLSGDAQFSSISTPGLATLRSRGAPVKFVAAGALYRPKVPTGALVAAPGKRITRASDLVGKRVGIDARYTMQHVAVLRWLQRHGVRADDVSFSTHPFAQIVGPLVQGRLDAAFVPEPYLTLALERGATRIADVFAATCSEECLVTVWMARRDLDPLLAARFRNAIQAAAVWANRKENRAASGAILARYAPIDRALIGKMARTTFATRLRPAQAQPWIDVFAELGVIPATFPAIELVR